MDPVCLMFAGLLLGSAWFCFASALEEYGDRQRWLAPAYAILGLTEVTGCISLVIWQL